MSFLVKTSQRQRNARPSNYAVVEPSSVFTVLKKTRSLKNMEQDSEALKVTVRGTHPTEDQAYSAAILEMVYELETAASQVLSKVRAIAKSQTLSLQDRLKSIQGCQTPETDERVEFVVQSNHVFPPENMDLDVLLEGPLIPGAYWDSSDDEDEYNPSDDDEDEGEGSEDSDDDEDSMELVDEKEYFEGIGGSGTKDDDEDEPEHMEQVPEPKEQDSEQKEQAPEQKDSEQKGKAAA